MSSVWSSWLARSGTRYRNATVQRVRPLLYHRLKTRGLSMLCQKTYSRHYMIGIGKTR